MIDLLVFVLVVGLTVVVVGLKSCCRIAKEATNM